jgi:hypothetical protein
MYLVDTNVWLESILDQERAEEARSFMRQVEGRLLAITEFSIYSVGVVLSRSKTGRPMNGWWWWKFKTATGEWVRLSELRAGKSRPAG